MFDEKRENISISVAMAWVSVDTRFNQICANCLDDFPINEQVTPEPNNQKESQEGCREIHRVANI